MSPFQRWENNYSLMELKKQTSPQFQGGLTSICQTWRNCPLMEYIFFLKTEHNLGGKLQEAARYSERAGGVGKGASAEAFSLCASVYSFSTVFTK